VEEDDVAERADAAPVGVCLRAVAGPQVQRKPDGLLCGEVRVAAPGPETTDDEATVQVLGRELALVLVWDAGGLQVLLLRALELPLLLVGEELDDHEEDADAGEDQVRDAEGGALGELGEDEEDVCRGGDQGEEERLGQADEEDVEKKEERPAVDLRPHYLPAVVFGADLVSPLAPVVVCQSDLVRGRGVSGHSF